MLVFPFKLPVLGLPYMSTFSPLLTESGFSSTLSNILQAVQLLVIMQVRGVFLGSQMSSCQINLILKGGDFLSHCVASTMLHLEGTELEPQMKPPMFY